MIQFENISKSFGGNTLFENVSFRLNPRERVGLVGRNGHGKTTLFRMIVNEEHPDGGSIIIPKQYRLGYVKQHLDFTHETVLEECVSGLQAHERDHHWKAEKILFGLGFADKDLKRSPWEFSGGYQVRLNLAKVLVSEPDLLLLDEPTNYLDIASIRWVERFLTSWPHEVMLITHDRGFMDKIVTHVVGINRKTARKIAGDTGKYYEQIAQDEEIYEKTRQNDEKRRKEVELFISRFRAKARLANMVQSRVKTLAKMEKRDKLEKLKTLDFAFKSKPFHGKYVMSAKHLVFSYNGQSPVIRNFSLNVGPRDRVCIIGKNGKGKTTLLKLLAGILSPGEGTVSCHPAVTQGFYEQDQVEGLVESRNVVEEILYSDAGVDPQTARNIAGAMMFEGNDALKKIKVLSGGEKSRVILAKLLVTPVNLLLLDEPTNHLDMESSDAMLAAVDNFDGTVIMVTHNEMFLHAVAQRLVVFQNGEINVFEGGYQDFLDKVGWQEDEKPGPGDSGNDDKTRPSKKEFKKIRSEFVGERTKVLYPLKKKIEETEKKIEKQEKLLGEMTREMQQASEAGDSGKIKELSRSMFKCQTLIDSLFEDLETLTETHDLKTAEFDLKQKEMEDQWN
jgi:ATP-binding cassette, subfamily F, member 3